MEGKRPGPAILQLLEIGSASKLWARVPLPPNQNSDAAAVT